MKPLIRWVGGKSKLVNTLLEAAPEQFNTYFEPFAGSLAFLLALEPEKANVFDINVELIHFYINVMTNPHLLMRAFEDDFYINTEENYYKVRDMEFDDVNNKFIQRAVRFLYLNKTCFNGLWRENKKGKFNVPYGFRKNVSFYDIDNLIAVSEYLNNHVDRINCALFSYIRNYVSKDDFVYFDPPYLDEKMFSNYNKSGFGYKDHIELRDLCVWLDKNGVKFLLSNSACAKELYLDFNVREIDVRHVVAASAKNRKMVGEILVSNY